LCPDESPPRELTYEPDGYADDPRFYVEPRKPTIEELEAEAIQIEACRELSP
jgi:hypothetical protein